MRRGLDILETVNIHDVVGGKMNPAGAHGALTPCPETLPCAAVHPPDETEGKAFEWG